QVQAQLPSSLRRDRRRGQDVRRLEGEEHVRPPRLGRRAHDVLDRPGRPGQENLEEGGYQAARRRGACRYALGRLKPAATLRNSRIRLHPSSSDAKSFAKQKRSIRLPASETKNAEPGTEATPASSSSALAAALSSWSSSGMVASM